MRFVVLVKLKQGILDPQGKAIKKVIERRGEDRIKDIRVGKYFEIEVEESNKIEAQKIVEKVAKDTLSNPIIETVDIIQ
ncbi:MAG: phosphoribosylformylglycinamidine synthase, purS protein [Candidatus Cloacimonas sp. 4484_209]|nr:phosphoribosylformylglycinamidine synthase subunit PurS [Deltaproteobacteria bacterium]OQX55216.1 MAG: phosphoribosylformylglycinamidine synthase, purS protein [Candidatus Cloacimonas sp. 4484_209]